jgi:hypothetical protein
VIGGRSLLIFFRKSLSEWRRFNPQRFRLLCSLLGLLGGLALLVGLLDLLEFLVVLFEVIALLESDEELGLLGLTVLLALHGDGLGLDLLEDGVLVSIK